MSRPARTFPLLALDGRSDELAMESGHQTRPPLVLLIGQARAPADLVNAAQETGSLILMAPDIPTARVWLDLAAIPEEMAGSGDGGAAPEGLVVDLQSQQARWRGDSLGLTDLELRLLAALLEAPGTAWTFADLSVTVWGSNHHGDRSMVRSAVQRLRRKLSSAGVGVRIVSLRGIGFRLVHSSTGTPWPERRQRRLHPRWRARPAPGAKRILRTSVVAAGRDQN